MHRNVPIRSLAVAIALATVAVAPAWASDSCRREAKINYKECKADSKEDFQAAKDACLNRDHECVEVCRAERYDCRQATGFDAAIAQINADLKAAKEQCRADHPAGVSQEEDDARDSCIDAEQVLAFQRRDQAREDAKLALKQCRTNFRSCAAACPPAGPEAPADPAQCKRDAKLAYKAAIAECKEDFQVAKDACRHKDHLCVEGCRDDRAECRDPVQAELASDVATCNTDKGTAFDDCDAHYGPNAQPPNTPNPELLDQCKDNAQVAAFQCRDDAREEARPGFQTCRQNFRTCVEGCPDV